MKNQKQFTRQQYLNKECTHREYYSQYVNSSTVDLVLNRFGIDRLQKAYSESENLNSIPLKEWDSLALLVTSGGKMKDNGDYLTLSGQVCILKEAARQAIDLTNKEA